MSSDKPWKGYDEQLTILKSRGMLVGDEIKASNYLERIGYYRLSGYWYSFRKHEVTSLGNNKLGYVRHDDFMENSYFEDAVKLYVFDKKLRLLALDALERIELSVRVDVAHLLGEKDIYAYENPRNFYRDFYTVVRRRGKTNHEEWLDSYYNNLKRSRKLPFVAHYMNKYGKLPIWVSTEIWDFGMLSKLFSGMQRVDQDKIAQKYGAVSGMAFETWLRGFNFIRNVSAHHSLLWNSNILERASPIKDDMFLAKLRTERAFIYFCLMQKLLSVICPNSSWGQRFSDLMDDFPEIRCKAVSLNDFDLPEDWRTWEFWG
ncbi:MAG: Abi family protein [Mariprofundaceae bacterium]|nr:Abi family protein [Mariprofundaceae bacterium]